jgi:membrane protein insertase Oxa1/YidC/SpoIIIJ
MSKDNQERSNAILQEIRIILPGTQALLGFQFVAFFNTAFKELSTGLQLYHLINLLFTTICTLLLIAPVAYQEILAKGRNTERWLRFTSLSLRYSMAFLLISLAGDIYIAATMLEHKSSLIPYFAAGSTLF